MIEALCTPARISTRLLPHAPCTTATQKRSPYLWTRTFAPVRGSHIASSLVPDPILCGRRTIALFLSLKRQGLPASMRTAALATIIQDSCDHRTYLASSCCAPGLKQVPNCIVIVVHSAYHLEVVWPIMSVVWYRKVYTIGYICYICIFKWTT